MCAAGHQTVSGHYPGLGVFLGALALEEQVCLPVSLCPLGYAVPAPLEVVGDVCQGSCMERGTRSSRSFNNDSASSALRPGTLMMALYSSQASATVRRSWAQPAALRVISTTPAAAMSRRLLVLEFTGLFDLGAGCFLFGGQFAQSVVSGHFGCEQIQWSLERLGPAVG